MTCTMDFSRFLRFFLPFFAIFSTITDVKSDSDPGDDLAFYGAERDALLALKAEFNNSFLDHNWTGIICYSSESSLWFGINCSKGRVTEIVLENFGLVAKIKSDALVNLTELTIFSLRNNSISGSNSTMMDFSFSQKLKRIDLSSNFFAGEISSSLMKLSLLESLRLQNNRFCSRIPELNQPSLRDFSVAYNNLSGAIPNTKVLQSFGTSSYLGNKYLCGAPFKNPCNTSVSNDSSDSSDPKQSILSRMMPFLVAINVIAMVVLLFLVIYYYKRYKLVKKDMHKRKTSHEREEKQMTTEEAEKSSIVGVDRGQLVFVDDEVPFELEDLLKASAEGLGKGNFGNCYRAMLANGPIVVKRLRDLKPLSSDEFAKQVKALGQLKHPNLLPLVGYYYSSDEKLLLTKFAPNDNLFNRIHSEKGTRARVPFRWNARLSAARGVARALEYLHQNFKSHNVVPHGNLKSSNVLFDEDDAVLVSDYGLISLIALPIAAQRMASYKSPEYKGYKKVFKMSDVWSYGCLLLELLTGRFPSDSVPEEVNAVDLCSWVHRAVREEWTAEIFDKEIVVQRNANHAMVKLLQIAMRCCDKSPERRPEMSKVLREVDNIKPAVESEEEESSSFDQSFTDDSASASMTMGE